MPLLAHCAVYYYGATHIGDSDSAKRSARAVPVLELDLSELMTVYEHCKSLPITVTPSIIPRNGVTTDLCQKIMDYMRPMLFTS
ncbi:hypothetical protein AAVH_33451 [Aphelenchoides avenae]|nr:hypothetical protein AAVH_33451 [Aphelenchus avenae]